MNTERSCSRVPGSLPQMQRDGWLRAVGATIGYLALSHLENSFLFRPMRLGNYMEPTTPYLPKMIGWQNTPFPEPISFLRPMNSCRLSKLNNKGQETIFRTTSTIWL